MAQHQPPHGPTMPGLVASPRPMTPEGQGIPIHQPKSVPPLAPIASSFAKSRTGQLTLDTFSPVSQNGSFAHDRVIKSGEVLKRTRKTKAWKSIYLVLRPNLLSIYKDKEESKLKHQVNLSDLTAVARQKDPKGKAEYVFGLFSPSRNYHLGARTEKEAQEWVEVIRREAKIDEEEEEDLILMSPGGGKKPYEGFERAKHPGRTSRDRFAHNDHMLSSSSEHEPMPISVQKRAEPAGSITRKMSHTMDYSGPEHGSYSDFSDAVPAAGVRDSSISLSRADRQFSGTSVHGSSVPKGESPYVAERAKTRQNQSQVSGLGAPADEERVIYQGWLYLLKSKGGVRQWKKVWTVLRPKGLATYKDEEEYSATLVLPFSSIIDVVEIDAISRSKRFCMQLLSEERNYRFAARDEESLTKWLGAFKSLLAKRKEAAIVGRS